MRKTILAQTISMVLMTASFSGYVIAEEAKPSDENIERIIVTGTSKGRAVADTPMSVTQINAHDLIKLSFSSQADVLRTVPGVKVEGGGGEVATNLQVRGLPSAGQFQFTPILIDGSPAFSTFGLNSSAFDVYFRNDLGIERLEFVRGGVSNLFGPGSVAGIINYITKKGGDEFESTVQLEVAEEGRTRVDFTNSGPLNDQGLYYAVSGFYRYDEGPIDTGLETKGGQFRGNIHKEFEDGTGSFTVYTQLIDDDVQFFLPFPLNGEDKSRAQGNDGRSVYSTQTHHASALSYQTATGQYDTPIEDGVTTQGGAITIEFNKDLSDDLSLNAKAHYADYDHEFNLFLDGDGITNIPETQAQYLANRGLPGIANAAFTWADTGEALPADYLLFANRILDRDRPAEDFSAEINLAKTLEAFEFDHTITFGSYFSKAEADDDNVITTYLAEFNNTPRLVNLTVTDTDGSISGVEGTNVTVSQNGLLGPGISYSNKTLEATRYAFYLADQFENDRWIFDLGVRWEHIEGDIHQEGSDWVTLSEDITLHPNLRRNRAGNGLFTIGEVTASEWAISGAALYRLSDNMNVYTNLSRGFFFPEIRGVRFNSLGEPGSYEAEIIRQGELGLKYFDNQFIGTAAVFFTNLDNRKTVDFVNDDQGGVVEIPITQSTDAWGVELTGQYQLTDTIQVDANLTWQDHEFKDYDANPDVIGKELRRKPDLLVNTGIKYDDGEWDASIYHSYHGDNFANDANTVRLSSFNLFRLDAGYTWSMGDGKQLRASVSIFNLFDDDGITEGSPRQGNNQTVDNQWFVGRPILPRRYALRIRYDF